jgi:hypothetical protein
VKYNYSGGLVVTSAQRRCIRGRLKNVQGVGLIFDFRTSGDGKIKFVGRVRDLNLSKRRSGHRFCHMLAFGLATNVWRLDCPASNVR